MEGITISGLDDCLKLFDQTRRVHGLGKRERLLLQISAILHNCGKYISLTDVPAVMLAKMIEKIMDGVADDEM